MIVSNLWITGAKLLRDVDNSGISGEKLCKVV